MSIRTARELEALRRAGLVVRQALDAMAAAAVPGITTAELDAICARVLKEHGAIAAPRQDYHFPGTACISVNDEAIHGIPGPRALADGDLLKLDVVASLDGFYADAAITVTVGAASETAKALARCAEESFTQALPFARAGNRVFDIGRAVETEVRRQGFNVIRGLCGHGVGRRIHEDPEVPNYFDPRCAQRLREGLVLTIEPIIAAGQGRYQTQPDGWTVRTVDGSLASHFEHTLVITNGAPLLLTAA